MPPSPVVTVQRLPPQDVGAPVCDGRLQVHANISEEPSVAFIPLSLRLDSLKTHGQPPAAGQDWDAAFVRLESALKSFTTEAQNHTALYQQASMMVDWRLMQCNSNILPSVRDAPPFAPAGTVRLEQHITPTADSSGRHGTRFAGLLRPAQECTDSDAGAFTHAQNIGLRDGGHGIAYALSHCKAPLFARSCKHEHCRQQHGPDKLLGCT